MFDVIFSSTQLSQDFKVSNGGPINKKIPVKINLGQLVISKHSFEIQRKKRIVVLVVVPL